MSPDGSARGAALNNSIPFDRYIVLGGDRGETITDSYLTRLERWELSRDAVDPRTGEVGPRRSRKRRPEDHRAIRAAIGAIVANLVRVAWHSRGPGVYVALGFGNGEYPKTADLSDRYKRSALTIGSVVSATNFLRANGLVEFEEGFYDRSIGEGRLSRMRPTDALVREFIELSATRQLIQEAGDCELIILKGPAPRRDATKPKIAYLDTPETEAWRSTLRQVNALLAATSIDLPDASAVIDDEADLEDVRDPSEPFARTLRRVFNNRSWEFGGRLYGGAWEHAHEEDRRRITINGEPTVELDFHALHPTLIYVREGLSLVGDPYVIDIEWPGSAVDLRKLAKTTFNRLLNGGSTRLNTREEDKALLGGMKIKAVPALLGREPPLEAWTATRPAPSRWPSPHGSHSGWTRISSPSAPPRA